MLSEVAISYAAMISKSSTSPQLQRQVKRNFKQRSMIPIYDGSILLMFISLDMQIYNFIPELYNDEDKVECRLDVYCGDLKRLF